MATARLSINWPMSPSGVRRVAAPGRDVFEYKDPTNISHIPILRRGNRDLIVIDFVNARDEKLLISFLDKYGLPNKLAADAAYKNMIGKLRQNVGEEIFDTYINYNVLIDRRDWFASIIEKLRKNKKDEAVKELNEKVVMFNNTSVRMTLSMTDGEPEIQINPDDLFGFMLVECMTLAASHVRFASCAGCGWLFCTGPRTGHSSKADYCSDACRGAAGRARRRLAAS